mgnify:CR=1 FL=1
MTTTQTETMNARAESPYFVVRTLNKAYDRYEKAADHYREQFVEKPLQAGRILVTGVSRDLKRLSRETTDGIRERLPDVEGIRGKITERLNLPTRADIERLNSAMDALSVRVEQLSEKCEA